MKLQRLGKGVVLVSQDKNNFALFQKARGNNYVIVAVFREGVAFVPSFDIEYDQAVQIVEAFR